MAATAENTVKITRMQALALVKVADMGHCVVEALELIQSAAAAEQATRIVNEAATRAARRRASITMAARAERRDTAQRKHQIFPRLSHSPPSMA